MCTVAWAKMYETIVTYDLFSAASLKASSRPTATAHLCEAPGRHFAQLYTHLANIFSLRYTGHIHKAALVTLLLLRSGAFICATNHYLKTHLPHISWDWRALTLNPYHEGNDYKDMISDDALIAVSFNT